MLVEYVEHEAGGLVQGAQAKLPLGAAQPGDGARLAGEVSVTGGGVLVRNNVLTGGLTIASTSPLTGVQVLGNAIARTK